MIAMDDKPVARTTRFPRARGLMGELQCRAWSCMTGGFIRKTGWLALLGLCVLGLRLPGLSPATEHYLIPPLKVDILDARERQQGRALVYPNYIELIDAQGAAKGAIGVVLVQGKAQLFLVRSGKDRKFIGWAENFRLFNTEDKLVGYYFWSPIWSYVYDPEMKKVGQAQCIAYQGVCAAGVAGFLLGLL